MNPFDDEHLTGRRSGKHRTSHRSSSMTRQQGGEPAIWAARNVDWPIPSSLSLGTYQKLVKHSRQAAGGAMDTSAEEKDDVTDGGPTYYGIAGLMSRVLNTSGTSQSDALDNSDDGEARPLRPPRPRCVAASNGWIVASLECGSLLRLVSRWNVRRGSSGGSDGPWIAIPGAGGDVVHVFCDPTGSHTLVSTNNGEAYYLHSSSRVMQKLNGFGPNDTTGLARGSYVTAVAWDKEKGTEGSSKAILLGTNLGELYEYTLEAEQASNVVPTLLHTLHNAQSDDGIGAVTGLYFERIGSSGLLVFCVTSGRHKRTRLYTYSSPTFTEFKEVFAQSHESLVELPGSIDFADLRVCDQHFCLRTATGIYYGTIDRGGTAAVVNAGMLPYEGGHIPQSIALTPHHFITLTETEVLFINKTSQKVIQRERISEEGELFMDIRRPDQVWLRKAHSLIHISSSCEDRDVWKFTLQQCLEPTTVNRVAGAALNMPDLSRQVSGALTIPTLTNEEKIQEGMFEHAKSLCTNTIQKSVVTAIRAEYHLQQGRTELAAKYLAQCPPPLAPFSDTCVRLALPMFGIDDHHLSPKAKKSLASSNLALITYLSDKMRVAKMNNDLVVCTMIGAWLAELYFHERSSSHESALLNQFLTQYVNSMDAKTIMRILASHDVGAHECFSFCVASGDVGTAVNAALCVGLDEMTAARDALRILKEAPFEIAEPFYYKYAPTLLARAPSDSCKSFLSRYSQGLSPTKLLPFIMHYETKRLERRKAKGLRDEPPMKQPSDLDSLLVDGSKSSVEVRLGLSQSFVDDDSAAIKYLEGVIKLGCRSSAIYTYLISLYAAMEDEEPLFRFLSTHVPAAATVSQANKKALESVESHHHRYKDESLSFPLDMSYALRTILGTGRHFRSAIKLYMGFGMRQQAVELALKVDPQLARELARESVDADERKRLWLMIAKNAAGGGDNRGGRDVVAKVVSVLKDCGPDVLSIEDVLPFLPDFAQIDQIKDEICDALTSYSSKIEGFLKEMNECDQTCDALREEIGRLSTYRMQMKADARCALTNVVVLNAGEPFYVFPSGYVIVESALRKEVMPFLNKKQRERVREVEGMLTDLRIQITSIESDDDNERKIQTLQSELDGLIAAECPLTGSIMIDSIDRGFENCAEADAAPVDPLVIESKFSGVSTTSSHHGTSRLFDGTIE